MIKNEKMPDVLIGVIISAFLLSALGRIGNDLPIWLDNENGAVFILLLIFLLGGIVGYLYLIKYKTVVIYSSIIAFIDYVYIILYGPNDYNLWPIALVMYLFFVPGVYFMGAFLTNDLLRKNKKSK